MSAIIKYVFLNFARTTQHIRPLLNRESAIVLYNGGAGCLLPDPPDAYAVEGIQATFTAPSTQVVVCGTLKLHNEHLSGDFVCGMEVTPSANSSLPSTYDQIAGIIKSDS